MANNQVAISNTPSFLVTTSNYTIPTNTYASIIYDNSSGNITLPDTANSINGQTLAIYNKGTGMLTILTQNLDMIKINNTTLNNNYALDANAFVNLVCDNENMNWVIIELMTATSSNVQNTYVTNLYGNPLGTNINFLSNMNLNNKKLTMAPVVIGSNASTNTNITAVAIGSNAGIADFTVAIGTETGTGISSNAVAIGYQACRSNAQNRSVCLGYQAGFSNNGQQAVAIGSFACRNATSLIQTYLAVGNSAGLSGLSSGSIAIGNQAASLVSNVNTNSVSIGHMAGSLGQKSNCIHIGKEVAASVIVPANNSYSLMCAIGTSANKAISLNTGSTITTSTYIGYESGSNLNKASLNVLAIGTESCKFSPSNNIIAIGYKALSNASNSTSSIIAIGKNTGAINGVGSSAIAVGTNAFAQTTTTSPSNNIRIGSNAGLVSTTSNNIAIGTDAQATLPIASSRAVAIGYEAGKTGQSSSNIIFCASNTQPANMGANVGFFVHPVRNRVGQPVNLFYKATTSGSGLACDEIAFDSSISDSRIKTNVEDLNDIECLNILENIVAKKFNYIDSETNENNYGFIAQDVEPYVPYTVDKTKGYLPDIWLQTNCEKINNGLKITLPTIVIETLTINDKLKLINNKQEYECNIETLAIDYLITKDITEDITDDITSIFVYGRWTNDLRNFNAEYMWAVEWGAAQQLLRRIENIENIINTMA